METPHLGEQIFDESNPRSVINLVPKEIANAIRQVPRTYFLNNERKLRSKSSPSELVCRLRVSFWHEYQRAQEKQTRMFATGIYAGVCSEVLFYEVIKIPRYCAYIVTPPVDYLIAMKESLMIGVEQLRDIITLPVKNDRGVVNHKNAELILKAFVILDNRVKGAVPQQVLQKSLNVNVNATGDAKMITELNMDEVDRKIKDLEMKIKAQQRKELEAPQREVRDTDVLSTPLEAVLVESIKS